MIDQTRRGYRAPQEPDRELPQCALQAALEARRSLAWTSARRRELKALVASIRQHPDLAQRLDLINSVDGIGLPTAVAILVRMPEIGQITREQAAALAGLAPYDDDSGEQVGARHIEGGRERLRRALYTAALPASFRWNQQLIALYQRLIAAGKAAQARAGGLRQEDAHLRQHRRRSRTPWQDGPPEKPP